MISYRLLPELNSSSHRNADSSSSRASVLWRKKPAKRLISRTVYYSVQQLRKWRLGICHLYFQIEWIQLIVNAMNHGKILLYYMKPHADKMLNLHRSWVLTMMVEWLLLRSLFSWCPWDFCLRMHYAQCTHFYCWNKQYLLFSNTYDELHTPNHRPKPGLNASLLMFVYTRDNDKTTLYHTYFATGKMNRKHL